MKAIIKSVKGGVTAPQGFQAAGVQAGIKKDRKDMALIVSAGPSAIAGVFTLNRVQAAPVQFCRKQLAGRKATAIIVNSGNANACTGRQGLRDAATMAHLTARALKLNPQTVFVCSTGTIGRPLPMTTIRRGIGRAAAALAPDGGADAARAIMTTDTRPKQAAVRLAIDGRMVTIGGMAKGAGMIHPQMATLLVFLTTDARVAPAALQQALTTAVNQSFNCISVDGDQSTNDTVLLMANGLAGNRPLQPAHPAWQRFGTALNDVTRQLAQMIVRDGEGATKFVTLTVKGAPNPAAARRVAQAVANSLLVKTSWFGADPNWGRVICAVGYAGVAVKPDRIDIAYNGHRVVAGGRPAGFDPGALHRILVRPEFSLEINLHLGRASTTIYTCDCSHQYVTINAAYMT